MSVDLAFSRAKADPICSSAVGPMPQAPADFSFWMAEVMPVDDQVKAALLQYARLLRRQEMYIR